MKDARYPSAMVNAGSIENVFETVIHSDGNECTRPRLYQPTPNIKIVFGLPCPLSRPFFQFPCTCSTVVLSSLFHFHLLH